MSALSENQVKEIAAKLVAEIVKPLAGVLGDYVWQCVRNLPDNSTQEVVSEAINKAVNSFMLLFKEATNKIMNDRLNNMYNLRDKIKDNPGMKPEDILNSIKEETNG